MLETSESYQIIEDPVACKSPTVGVGGEQKDCIGSTVGGVGSIIVTVVGKRSLVHPFSVCCTQ